jgi:hypothetical protein
MTRFDQDVWICGVQETIVAFGSKGGDSSNKAPAYSQASADAAKAYTDLAKDQFDWSKDIFNEIWPQSKDYLNNEIKASEDSTTNAEEDRSFYKDTYKPIETDYAKQAKDYNSKERSDENASAAMADVASDYEASRKSYESNLESYGIDPSQTRYAALDLGSRVSEAAASAAAGTKSKLNTEATGLGLESSAINIGRGYSADVNAAYNTGASTGSSGVSSANSTSSTGASTQGSAKDYGALGLTGYSNASTGSNQTSDINYKYSSNTSSGIGSLIGGGLSAFSLFSDRRLKTDIVRVGQLDNGLPVYAYRFRGDRHVQIGLMADEVERLHPGAVSTDPGTGYSLVNYGLAVR